MIPLIAVCVLCLALLGAFMYRERVHDAERRELIDRITYPEVARTAAFARAIDAPPVPDDLDALDDERYGRPLDDLTPDFAYGDS